MAEKINTPLLLLAVYLFLFPFLGVLPGNSRYAKGVNYTNVVYGVKGT